MTIHILKSQPAMFEAILSGMKAHELRLADRLYNVGDVLDLQEYSHDKGYTGRMCKVNVTYVTNVENMCPEFKSALNPEYAILTVKVIK